MEQKKIPGIIVRVKAIITDSIVMLILMIVITYVFSLFKSVPNIARMAAFVFVFVLYDPLFTSIFGGTIGHMLFGLRVKRESHETKNILFHLAILRFMVKALLGIISLITVSGNKKGKAIHDYLVGSIVIYASDVKNRNDRNDNQ